MLNVKTWFAHLSLARKLTALGVLTAAAALTLACAGFVAYDVSSSRQRLVRDMSMVADVIVDLVTALLQLVVAAVGLTITLLAMLLSAIRRLLKKQHNAIIP